MPPNPQLTKFITASPVIVTYDWKDNANGTGIQTLYFAQYKDNTAVGYFLAENTTIYSYTEEFALDAYSGSNSDINYDLTTFNTPRTIRGTAVLNIPWHSGSDGLGNTATLYFIVKIRKWNSTTSTETEIVSATTETKTISHAGGGSRDGGYFCLTLDVPETLFAEGETLRVTLEAYPVNGAQIHSFHGCDPANRQAAGVADTRGSITIPFKTND